MPHNVNRPAGEDRRAPARRRGEEKVARDGESPRAAPPPTRFDGGVEAKTLEEVRRRRGRADS